MSISEDVKKMEQLYIVGRNFRWYSNYGKQFNSSPIS